MDTLIPLIDRYINAWNETAAPRRRELIARTWAADARYVDPLLQSEGHDGIDAMIAGLHEHFPGHRFRRVGDIDVHHQHARFRWALAPEVGPSIVEGTDFAVIDADQRLASVTGFFDVVAVPA